MQAVEKACLADLKMKSRSFIFLPRASTVRVEPWAYATDGMNDMTQRVLMVCTLSL